MTTWGCRRVAVGLLALVHVAACGGRPSGGVARAARTAPTTTFAVVVQRPASRPPVVRDRGAGPVAIARSLLLWGRWLEAEHPDPALVDRAYAWGGELERGVLAEVTALRRTNRRVIEIDAAPLELVIVSQLPDAVTLRVAEHLDHRELVDVGGRVLDHAGPATEHYIVLIQRVADDDPWRLAAVEGVQPRTEVRL